MVNKGDKGLPSIVSLDENRCTIDTVHNPAPGAIAGFAGFFTEKGVCRTRGSDHILDRLFDHAIGFGHETPIGLLFRREISDS